MIIASSTNYQSCACLFGCVLLYWQYTEVVWFLVFVFAVSTRRQPEGKDELLVSLRRSSVVM